MTHMVMVIDLARACIAVLARQQVIGCLILLLALSSSTPANSQQINISINKGKVSATKGVRGLPPTNMDSFVYQAGGNAEHIYGDEGYHGKPPYMEFLTANRIDAGIYNDRDAGLTTGHGSYMPDAWGADEFLQAPNGEWGQSGARGDTPGSNMDGSVDYAPADNTPIIGLPGTLAVPSGAPPKLFSVPVANPGQVGYNSMPAGSPNAPSLNILPDLSNPFSF
jgi:hypothetical protein